MRDYHFQNLQIVLLRHWWISLCLSQICWTFHGYLSWGFGTRQENQFNDAPPPTSHTHLHTQQKISSCPWDRKCNFFFNFLLFLFLSSLLIFFHSFLSSPLFFFLSHFPFSQTLSIFFLSFLFFFFSLFSFLFMVFLFLF